MCGGLPVTGVVHTADVDIVAIAVGKGGAVGGSNRFLDGFSLGRGGICAGILEDRVAIKTAGIIAGAGPGYFNRVIGGPGAQGVAGAVDTGRVGWWNSILKKLPLPFIRLTLDVTDIV